MTRITEVFLLLVSISVFCDISYSSPLFEGINIERKINIDFKPIKFRPLTFIREKWGPFGRFGKKHTIERRDLDSFNIIDKSEDVKPVVEKIDEPQLFIPAFKPPVQVTAAPSEPPPPEKPLNTDISPAIPSNPYFSPVGVSLNYSPVVTLGTGPVVDTNPIEGPLIVPVKENEEKPAPASVEPPKPPPQRPSIIAFFSEFFTELMTRLIARARASFSQLGSPPVQQ